MKNESRGEYTLGPRSGADVDGAMAFAKSFDGINAVTYDIFLIAVDINGV